MSRPIVFLLKGYPRLSETFIAEEILGLERRGFDIRIVAMRQPTDGRLHPVHEEIAAPVSYLPEYLHHAPFRVLRSWWAVRHAQGLAPAWRQLRRDLWRDPSRNRVRRFGQALVLAAEMPPGVAQIHAHFIHTPGSVAGYAATITALPWSCSAHAKDIWTSQDWDLAQKLGSARWTVTCTATGRDRLQALSPARKPVTLVYHGLDLGRFRPLRLLRSRRDGSDPAEPVLLLAVGRAVEKKGFDLLLDALAGLPEACAWRLVHIGGGPDLAKLRAEAERRGIAPRITWCGPQDQRAVLERYRQADLFVLPCRIAGNGDRDGLPNVLVEAQSQGLACVSTRVGGVPELIQDGINGRLVPPDDSAALAAALVDLIRDPGLRHTFGRAGQGRVARLFDSSASLDVLAGFFRAAASEGPRRDTAIGDGPAEAAE